MRRFASLAAAFTLALGLAAGPAHSAPNQSFDAFIRDFEAKAVAAGISRDVYRQATKGLTADPSIPTFQATQPEFETPIWDYIEGRVSERRVSDGRAAVTRNKPLFDRIGREFGVDPYILAAIWGMESDYGAILSNRTYIKPVIRSLASLVHQRRGRLAADEAEFIAALRIIQQGDARADTLVGSWAGAIGHLQLIPTAFLRYATDEDGDGRRDPHGSLADALASSAKYLRDLGYQTGHDWGYEVELPSGFDYALAGREQYRPVSFFAQRGVKRVAGREFSDLDESVFLYVPAGRNGPKFLMTANYLVLKGYNFSDSYALAVAHLTDRLKGAGPFVDDWPRDAHFLNRAQRVDLQERLKRAGYYDGEVDGRLGPITARALSAWQAANGQVADGFATLEAYQALRSGN